MNITEVFIIALLTGLTAFLSHTARAVFHDGIRPVIPEFVEGRMKRRELGSIAFGLSIGFIASVGIAFTLPTGLLNPWLLFLPTDIIGIVSPKKWIAVVGGAAWGVAVVTGLTLIEKVFSLLPIDFLSALGELSGPVVAAFALFPLLAILYQFGVKKCLLASAITLLVRQLIVLKTALYPEAYVLGVGMILLIAFAMMKDLKDHKLRGDEPVAEGQHSIFEERTARLLKNVPFLALAGGLIAVAANLKFFAGSEVSIYTLADAYSQTGAASAELVKQAAIAEVVRGIGFIPLIATTALATGVYGVAGLTFVYAIGYMAPSWIVALIGGAIMIVIEVSLLRAVGKGLERFPSIREASDNIRNAMNQLMTIALLIGSVMAVMQMGGYAGFFIMVLLYVGNEALGSPVIKLAAAPAAAIVTGIILNLLYMVGLHVI